MFINNYKSFFNKDNPLNIYQGLTNDGSFLPKPASTPKMFYESDVDYEARLKQEEEQY